MPVNLAKVDARSRLAPRRDPYWHRVEAGCYIGFRKMTADGLGTWSARKRSDDGTQTYHPLGELADHPPHARYDEAVKFARQWFAHLGIGGRAEPVTVRLACEQYVAHLEASGRASAASDAEKRFARWVYPQAFAAVTLAKLRPTHVGTWRAWLAGQLATPQDKTQAADKARKPGTLNRDMTSLRAALNLALENGSVGTDAAWKAKLRPIENADGRRDVYLDIGQRRELIAAAETDAAALLRGLSLLPLRPGALAALTVSSFNARLAALTIGRDKNGQERKIPLPKSTADYFAGLCGGRPADAPIFARADGSAWNKDAWKGPIKAAVLAAGLPASATAYSLRHSTITDLIAVHKLDTLTVAQLSDTSLVMIEKHYGHLLLEHARQGLASLSL